jgi:hypothetical protein
VSVCIISTKVFFKSEIEYESEISITASVSIKLVYLQAVSCSQEML